MQAAVTACVLLLKFAALASCGPCVKAERDLRSRFVADKESAGRARWPEQRGRTCVRLNVPQMGGLSSPDRTSPISLFFLCAQALCLCPWFDVSKVRRTLPRDIGAVRFVGHVPRFRVASLPPLLSST
ncbi:hypothetical protein HBI56_199300 [Parastagonospora nodorum]|nr:hypothetical protein HBI10_209670 [Parastagonospora nodorum]KAH4010724.1 hypothetical protein HBI13_206530 [Parastagonospora nodorum]KAH4060061.1 hypothetical protein HBH50_226260 [Parastagonospora nodorum]KAH4077956.1 hypothetical protein HBH48_236350 [Parastagonospora nodorum]KAH4217490.1 hypothetical protein HBI06_214410 [Parastagonospora nodorum]